MEINTVIHTHCATTCHVMFCVLPLLIISEECLPLTLSVTLSHSVHSLSPDTKQLKENQAFWTLFRDEQRQGHCWWG